MRQLDLNLLVALDALLSEASVTRAARVLGLSASAMSRTLARLREATGDQLLVRAGNEMVLTPYADSIRERTRDAMAEARAVLSPSPLADDLRGLRRSFRIRANEAFVQAFGAALIAETMAAAPQVRLHFLAKPVRSAAELREGSADLEIGVVEAMGPEVRTRAIFHDRYLAAVRAGHPLDGGQDGGTPFGADEFSAFGHIATPYDERIAKGLDAALAALGSRRHVVAVVPSFAAALAVSADSDLIALLPASFASSAGHRFFELPVPVPEFAIAQMWHPRLDADPAHRWLRQLVIDVCRRRFPR